MLLEKHQWHMGGTRSEKVPEKVRGGGDGSQGPGHEDYSCADTGGKGNRVGGR